MRSIGVTTGAVLAFAAAAAGVGTGVAQADPNDAAINGTFSVTSNGEWARTNDSYHDEMSVRQTWTVTSSCATVEDCSGTVVSDQGWTAGLTTIAGTWYVYRDLPDWEHCDDGTAATGRQIYRFFPWDENTQMVTVGSPTLIGELSTSGPSGACGWNKQLVIKEPVKVVKLA